MVTGETGRAGSGGETGGETAGVPCVVPGRWPNPAPLVSAAAS